MKQNLLDCFGEKYSKSSSTVLVLVQLRGNQKDFNFQLHHHLSKFEVPVVVNLKHIFEIFGLYTTCFLIQKLLELNRSSSDGQFWRKSQNKKGGKFELRSQLCYYNCKTREMTTVEWTSNNRTQRKRKCKKDFVPTLIHLHVTRLYTRSRSVILGLYRIEYLEIRLIHLFSSFLFPVPVFTFHFFF